MRLLTAITLLCLAGVLAPAGDVEIAVIDLERIVNQLPETARIETDVRAEMEKLRTRVDARWKEIGVLSHELASTRKALSEAEAARRQKALMVKERELSEFWTDESERIKRDAAKAGRAVSERIESRIAEHAANKGYALVFDRKSGRLMYADKKFNRTREFIKLLSPPGEKPGAKKAPPGE